MSGKHSGWLLIAFFLLLTATSISWAIVGVTPRLTETLLTSPKENFVHVNAVLSDQLHEEDLLKLVMGKPRRQWRGITVPIMKEHSAQTQARLRHDLDVLQQSGDVRNIHIIWLSNAINFEAKIETLNGFFERYPELRSLDLDPNIPIENVIDVGTHNAANTQQTDELNTTDWGLDDMQCHQVWAHGFWGQGILIANIDTGCDTTHPALQPKIWHNTGEIPGNGIDDDQNGYIDDIIGWNFDQNTNNPNPAISHGTNTSGIMVGSFGNDTVGVAPQAHLMVLRDNAGAASGGMGMYWLAEQYAVDNGADVISSSLSFKWPNMPDYATFRQNTDMELVAGVIHANSIGNQGTDLTNYPIPYNISTPGNCPPPWLAAYQTLRGGLSSAMGVGAYQAGHVIANYSGIGPAAWDSIPSRPTTIIPVAYRDYPYLNGAMQALLKPDIAMPTDSRTTDWPGGGYMTGFDGTSAATPHLGGALAVLLSAEPDATPMEVCEALKMTADTSGTNNQHNLYGSGRAKIWNAVQYLIDHTRSGVLRCTVYDTLTLLPINHAALSVLSSMTYDSLTDSLGRHTFNRVRAGMCSLFVSAPGYTSRLITNLQVDSAETTIVTVYMRGPRISFIPDSSSYILHQGEATNGVLRIINTGFDTLRWNLTVARTGFLDTTYQNLLNVSITASTHDGRINGIEYAWGKIWVTGDNNLSNPNYFYRFNRNGTFIDSIRQPHPTLGFGFRDLAFDGQYLWGSDASYLYGVDSNGVLCDSVYVNLNPARAIAIDPVTHNFYIGDQITPIQIISRNGQNLGQLSHTLHIYGLAWYAADPDSMPLYILSEDSTPACLLSKMNPVTHARRALKLITTSSTQVGCGLAFADDWSYENRALLAIVRNNIADSAYLRVLNLGYVPRWLTLSRSTGQLVSSQLDSIQMNISAVNAPVGTWNVAVQAQNNSPRSLSGSIIHFQVLPTTSVPGHDNQPIPTGFVVSELYPNPFNPTTSISVSLPSESPLSITMFDRLGRETTTLHRDRLVAGNYRFELDGKAFASGVYFVQIKTRFGTFVRKGVLLK